MTLDGVQNVLSDRFHTNRLGKVDLRFKNAHKADRTVAYANKQELEDAVFQSRIKSAAIPEQTPPVVLHMGRPTGTGRVL